MDEIAANPCFRQHANHSWPLVLMRSAGDEGGYILLLVKDFKQCTGNVWTPIKLRKNTLIRYWAQVKSDSGYI